MSMCAAIRYPLQIFSLCIVRGGLVVSQRARVQRGPSEAARCASTGNRQAPLPFFSLYSSSALVLEGVAKAALDCAPQ
jgi:hypothetical protein